MRISDWSSDVCSSDLGFQQAGIGQFIRLGLADAALGAFRDEGPEVPLFVRALNCPTLAARACAGSESIQCKTSRVARNLPERARALRSRRSEELRVGEVGVRTSRNWWWAYK